MTGERTIGELVATSIDLAATIRVIRIETWGPRHVGPYMATYSTGELTWSSGWMADVNTALDHLARAIERWPMGPHQEASESRTSTPT